MLLSPKSRERTASNTAAQESKGEQREESAPPVRQDNAATTNNVAVATGSSEEAAPTSPPPTTTSTPRRPPALWKSPRLKGYLTLVLASIINYNAAYHSNDAIFNNAIASTPKQQRYAMAVSLVSTIVSAFAVVAHLDRYSPLQKLWRTMFQPKSRFELALLLFFIIWWGLATGIQTSIRGIAGDGKGQYNLYFSSWVCALSSMWMLERWWVSFGWSSFSTFLSSWPHRAPGWMAMTFMSLFTLIWYIDLYNNWRSAPQKNGVLLLYQKVRHSQWDWLLFITGFTMLPGSAFVLIELFRETAPSESRNDSSNNNRDADGTSSNNHNPTNHLSLISGLGSPRRAKGDGTTPRRIGVRRRLSEAGVVVRPIITVSNDGKGACENITEGICLFVLVVAWIPSVVIATSPGGIASLVGNSYFFTWATSIFVAETMVWWVHDWRKNIHSLLAKQAREYQQKQKQVLKKSLQIQQRAAIAAAHAVASTQSEEDDDDDEEDDDDDQVHHHTNSRGERQRDRDQEEQKSEEGNRSPQRRRSLSDRGEPEGSEFFDALEEITDGL